MALCICDSKKEYSICCEPLLTGSVKAKTVRQLVRSRYAAYAAGGRDVGVGEGEQDGNPAAFYFHEDV